MAAEWGMARECTLVVSRAAVDRLDTVEPARSDRAPSVREAMRRSLAAGLITGPIGSWLVAALFTAAACP